MTTRFSIALKVCGLEPDDPPPPCNSTLTAPLYHPVLLPQNMTPLPNIRISLAQSCFPPGNTSTSVEQFNTGYLVLPSSGGVGSHCSTEIPVF